MATNPPATHTIEVDEQVYDVLARTARSRDTEINGVLKYLLEAPAVTAVPSPDDDEELAHTQGAAGRGTGGAPRA